MKFRSEDARCSQSGTKNEMTKCEYCVRSYINGLVEGRRKRVRDVVNDDWLCRHLCNNFRRQSQISKSRVKCMYVTHI